MNENPLSNNQLFEYWKQCREEIARFDDLILSYNTHYDKIFGALLAIATAVTGTSAFSHTSSLALVGVAAGVILGISQLLYWKQLEIYYNLLQHAVLVSSNIEKKLLQNLPSEMWFTSKLKEEVDVPGQRQFNWRITIITSYSVILVAISLVTYLYTYK